MNLLFVLSASSKEISLGVFGELTFALCVYQTWLRTLPVIAVWQGEWSSGRVWLSSPWTPARLTAHIFISLWFHPVANTLSTLCLQELCA